MKKSVALLLLLTFLLDFALADNGSNYPETAYLPNDIRLVSELNDTRMYENENKTELWTVTRIGDDCLCEAEIQNIANVSPNTLVAQRWNQARILRSAEDEVLFVDDNIAGSCKSVGKTLIIEMRIGKYYSGDRLTAQGAIALLALYRPQARVIEIELDDDDGKLIYEGEALVNGEEYEFEMDIYTGKLLEWDRD